MEVIAVEVDKRENTDKNIDSDEARREFIKKCGRFAVVVPPAMALLLTRGRSAYAGKGEEKVTGSPMDADTAGTGSD